MTPRIGVHELAALQLDAGPTTLLVVYGLVMALIAVVGITHIRRQVTSDAFGEREGSPIDEETS